MTPQARAEVTDDMTTAYMVGYEAGKAEARALDVERLARALHATARRGHIGLLPDLTACTSADVHREDAAAIAREYLALEEPTDD
jgi:hypothetical protein